MRVIETCVPLAILLVGLVTQGAFAKHATVAPADQNGAVILGMAGESYPIYGAGGIRVTGGHHGIFSSNMKSSQIEIDGSGISSQKPNPFYELTDFAASTQGRYFVYHSAICTLPSALDVPGEEVVICNGGKDVTITYQTLNAETILGGEQPGAPIVNKIPGRVDRFISDGKVWYHE